MKHCCSCKQTKSDSDFNKSKQQKDGLARRCRDCEKEQCKRSYWKHLDKQRERCREKNRHKRAWLDDYKKNLACEECGDVRWYVLDFHHPNKDKEGSVAMLRLNKEKAMKEIVKCRVLCSNCHRELHYMEKCHESSPHGMLQGEAG